MNMTNEISYGDHGTHAKGLAAFMKIEESPLNLLTPVMNRSGHSKVSTAYLIGMVYSEL